MHDFAMEQSLKSIREGLTRLKKQSVGRIDGLAGCGRGSDL